MLDIKFIRENQEKVQKALKSRGVDFNLKHLLEVDEKRRAKIKEVDDLRAKQNNFGETISKLTGADKEEKIKESQKVKNKLASSEEELKQLNEEWRSLIYKLPNIPEEGIPIGKSEKDNKVLWEEGEKKTFNFNPKDYMEIARAKDLIDTERAAKVSGTRFGYLKGKAALLEMALAQFAFAKLLKNDFIPIVPPILIKEEMMKGMGYIDSEEDLKERYFLEKDGLYLVGTSEQSIGPMHAGEIFNEKDLPRRYVSFSTCFRREAGSYGKDTHGILRVHQFDKVEMFSFAHPENSRAEHEFLLNMEENLMQELNIPYRVMQLCTGDLSHPSASTYDIQSWLPGQNEGKGEYRETHSASNTTDFQSRRLNIKFRKKDGELSFVHMLNGTAFAIGRMLIAIIENYQQKDGSILIPDALLPYMNGIKKIYRGDMEGIKEIET